MYVDFELVDWLKKYIYLRCRISIKKFEPSKYCVFCFLLLTMQLVNLGLKFQHTPTKDSPNCRCNLAQEF